VRTQNLDEGLISIAQDTFTGWKEIRISSLMTQESCFRVGQMISMQQNKISVCLYVGNEPLNMREKTTISVDLYKKSAKGIVNKIFIGLDVFMYMFIHKFTHPHPHIHFNPI